MSAPVGRLCSYSGASPYMGGYIINTFFLPFTGSLYINMRYNQGRARPRVQTRGAEGRPINTLSDYSREGVTLMTIWLKVIGRLRCLQAAIVLKLKVVWRKSR